MNPDAAQIWRAPRWALAVLLAVAHSAWPALVSRALAGCTAFG